MGSARARWRAVGLLLATPGALLALPQAPGPAIPAEGEVVARVRAAVYPALVNISVVQESFSDGRAHRYPGAGSGVVVTPEGHVLTNYHVAGDAKRVSCTLTDGRVFDAEILVDDPLTDLTVLALEVPAGDAPLAHASLGDSDGLRVGDTVFAMGNPLALSSSMTQGIVSNPARVFTDFTGTEIQEMTLGDDELSGLLTRWIQHDALILPGNSGGPLVDRFGQVIGINELGGRGIGFAIPSSIARDVLDQALSRARISRGWLGLSVLPVEKIGRRVGALVSTVLPGSAAEQAGIEAGDILLAVGGEPVQVRFFEEVPVLYQRIAALPVGEEVAVELERDGAERTTKVRVAAMPRFRGEEWEVRELGMTVQEITEPMAISRQLPSADGLLLTGIRPGSPADDTRPRLNGLDVLLRIGGEPVTGPESLRQAITDQGPGDKLVVTVRRREEEIVTLLPAPSERNGGWGGELPKAWLGVRTQVVTPELSEHLGLGGRTGFRITQVYPWTEAQRADLRVGDVIVGLAGEPLQPTRQQESEDLRRVVEELYIDDEVAIELIRDGDPLTVSARLEARPTEAEEVATATHADLELTVRDITFADRISNRWPQETSGAVVVEVPRGGWAQMAGLRLGDLILEVNDRPVVDADSFGSVMEVISGEQPRLVKIFVRRGYRTHFVLIEPDWETGVSP